MKLPSQKHIPALNKFYFPCIDRGCFKKKITYFFCVKQCVYVSYLFPPLVIRDIYYLYNKRWSSCLKLIYLSNICTHFSCWLSFNIPKDRCHDLCLLFLVVFLVFDQWMSFLRLVVNIWTVDWTSIYLNKLWCYLGLRLSWFLLSHIFKKLHCILIWYNAQNTKLEFTESVIVFYLRALCYTSK